MLLCIPVFITNHHSYDKMNYALIYIEDFFFANDVFTTVSTWNCANAFDFFYV